MPPTPTNVMAREAIRRWIEEPLIIADAEEI